MVRVQETFLDSDDDHLSFDSESEPDFKLSDSEEDDGEYEESFISKGGTRWKNILYLAKFSGKWLCLGNHEV